MDHVAPHNDKGLAALFLRETCERLLKEAIGPYLDDFVEELRAAGYCSLTIRQYVGPVVHLGVWLARRGTRVVDLDSDVVATFARHLRRRCRCRRRSRVRRCARSKTVMLAVRLFVEHLRKCGVVAARPQPTTAKIVAEFELWMRQHRGSAERTLADYRPIVASFAAALRGRRWWRLDAKIVRRYVIGQRERGVTPARMLVLVRALRMFVRFLVATVRCASHLERSVPAMPHWRLASVPRYLPTEVVERIIASRPATTLLGVRDRAVLLLLARLGLRAGEVRALRFTDIDWNGGRIRIVGKTRRPTWMPLPQEVGDAILSYLRVRPMCDVSEVFLCWMAPRRPLGATSVGSICQRAIDQIGVSSPSKGAHVLRHSAATTLLRHGATLDDVGRLLRHASRESTAIYAKVALPSLVRIAQPWPEST